MAKTDGPSCARRPIVGSVMRACSTDLYKNGINFLTRRYDFSNIGGYGKIIQLSICGYGMDDLIHCVLSVMIILC